MAIHMVLITELINSVAERVIDYLRPEYHPKAKIIKDIAAGIVLLSQYFRDYRSVNFLVKFLGKLVCMKKDGFYSLIKGIQQSGEVIVMIKITNP